MKIDMESQSHPKSINKRRNFFKRGEKNHSVRGVAISLAEPSLRGSAEAALNNHMGVLVGATFKIFFLLTFM